MVIVLPVATIAPHTVTAITVVAKMDALPVTATHALHTVTVITAALTAPWLMDVEKTVSLMVSVTTVVARVAAPLVTAIHALHTATAMTVRPALVETAPT
ncbi:hypothetical protein, partial [Arthrobacter psychrochitiniphilus]